MSNERLTRALGNSVGAFARRVLPGIKRYNGGAWWRENIRASFSAFDGYAGEIGATSPRADRDRDSNHVALCDTSDTSLEFRRNISRKAAQGITVRRVWEHADRRDGR